VQKSIFEHSAEYEIGLELKSISAWLDQNMDLLDWVAADISPYSVEDTDRKGLSVESVLQQLYQCPHGCDVGADQSAFTVPCSKYQGRKRRVLRIDSTVTATPMHEPSDSSLLWASVRTLVRLLQQAEKLAIGTTVIKYHNHQRVAKKRVRAIVYTRGQDKKERLSTLQDNC